MGGQEGLIADREERVRVLRGLVERDATDDHLLRLADGLRLLAGPLGSPDPTRAARLLAEAREILDDLPLDSRETVRARTYLLQVLDEQFRHAAWKDADEQAALRIDAEKSVLVEEILADDNAEAPHLGGVFYALHGSGRWAHQRSIGTVDERIARYQQALSVFRRFEGLAEPSAYMRQCAQECEAAIAVLD